MGTADLFGPGRESRSGGTKPKTTAKRGGGTGALFGAGGGKGEKVLDIGPAASAPGPEGRGVVGTVFEYLGRPGQAITSALAEAAKPGDTPGAMLKAGLAGLTGRRRDMPEDVVENLLTRPGEARYELKGPARFVTNIGGGIALDPLTYATFGTSAAAKAGLKTAETVLGAEKASLLAKSGLKALDPDDAARLWSALEETPKVQKALAKGAQGGVKVAGRTVLPGGTLATAAEATKLSPLARAVKATPPAQALADVFVPRAAIARRFGKDVADRFNAARIAYRASAAANIEDDLARIAKAARDAGASAEEMTSIVGRALDVGGGGVAVPERLRGLVDELKAVRQRFTDAQIEAGVAAEDALRLTDEYFPRYLTKEGEAFFGRTARPVTAGARSPLSAPSKKLGQRRYLPETPVAELTDDAGRALFETDPTKAFTRRAVEAHRDVAARGFLDDLARITDDTGESIFRRADDLAAADLPHGWTTVEVPKLGKFAAPTEIVDELRHVMDVVFNDQSLKRFSQFADKWMALWKGYATGPRPGFHIRNGIGNLALNDLAGDIRLTDYAHAQRLQRAMTKGKRVGDIYAHLDDADRAIVAEARRHGVVGEGFFGAELPEDLLAKATGRRRLNVNPLSQENVLLRSGRKVGSAFEDNARLAHFIAKRRTLGSAEQAAQSVRKYLFDYSDLTAIEKRLFRRVNGFYTFTRKNVPVQVEALLRTPGKITRLEHLSDALSGSAPAEGFELTPDYLARSGAMRLPQGVPDALARVPGLGYQRGEPGVLDVSRVIPFYGAAEALRPGVELVTGKGSEGRQGAIRELLSEHISGGVPGAVSSLAQYALGEQLFGGRPIRDGAEFLAEENLPLVGSVRAMFPRDASEAARRAAGRRRLSNLAGLPVTQLSPATRAAEARRRREALRAALRRAAE